MKMFRKNILRGVIKNWSTYIGAACLVGLGAFIYISMMDMSYNLQCR